MKVNVGENGTLEVTEVWNEIILKTNDGEKLIICMRDQGFEAKYMVKDRQSKGIRLTEGIIETFDYMIIDENQNKDE